MKKPQEYPVLVQKAAIKKGKKYLIVLRSPTAPFFPNHWDFSGGKLEYGENPFEGIEREILEETALTAKATKVIGIYEFDLLNKGLMTHRFTIYSANIISGKIMLSFEHSDYKWATKEEIMKLTIEPFMKKFFEEN